jgi:hypothetical protein
MAHYPHAHRNACVEWLGTDSRAYVIVSMLPHVLFDTTVDDGKLNHGCTKGEVAVDMSSATTCGKSLPSRHTECMRALLLGGCTQEAGA